MVSLTTYLKNHSLPYFLLRGLLIIIVGVMIDIAFWKIYPFMTVDILYLIGLSLPIAYLINKFSPGMALTVAIIIFITTPILQYMFGYTTYPTEIYLTGKVTVEVENQTSVLNHWMVDGWFPIFPWLAYVFFGVFLEKIRRTKNENELFISRKFIITGLVTLVIGTIVWKLLPGPLLDREGYSEIFFPPTIGYMIMSIGVVLLVIYLCQATKNFSPWKLIKPMGSASLLMYILHIFSADTLLYHLNIKDLDIKNYFLIYLVILAGLIIISHIVRVIKQKTEKMPFILGFLLGH